MEGIFFLLGLIFMQIIYLLMNYMIFKKKGFSYYIHFISLTMLFIVFTIFEDQIPFLRGLDNFESFSYSYLLIVLSFYYRFLRHLVEAPKNYPSFNSLLVKSEYVFIFTGLVAMINYLIFGRNGFFFYVAVSVYGYNIILQFYVMYFLIRTKDFMNILILIGAVSMGIMFKIGIVPNLMDFDNPIPVMPLSYSFLIGMSIDFLFFNFVLIYQSRALELKMNTQQIEKQKELFDQRVEIGQDLHDHLGASLSGLNVFSDIAKRALDSDKKLAGYYLDKLSFGIKQLMSNMNDVVWALNDDPSQEKLLTSRIKDFYLDIFEAKEIICTYEVDPEVEKKITRIKARKNILLIAKESINNAIKHSNSDRIIVSLNESEGFLRLLIRDFGTGFLKDSPNSGKGLGGLHLRTEQLGGSLEIGNCNDSSGAFVSCKIPVANISDFSVV